MTRSTTSRDPGTALAARRPVSGRVVLLMVLASLWYGSPQARGQNTQAAGPDAEAWLLAHPESIPALLAEKTLMAADIPNPHWREDACRACHRDTPTEAEPNLREQGRTRLCTVCHDAVSADHFLHPVGMAVPQRMLARVTDPFAAAVSRSNGVVACTTCHDLAMQSQAARAGERGLNPYFLWEGPYAPRTELCYRCHDARAYGRLDPHDQVSDAGVLREQRCEVCHRDVPTLKTARSIGEVKFTVDGDLSALCTRCHEWIPHPGGGAFSFTRKSVPDHLVVPPAPMRKWIEEAESRYGVAAPLDPGTGKVFCGTCHNPHERGVVQRAAAQKGADSKHRLRVSGNCLPCHRK